MYLYIKVIGNPRIYQVSFDGRLRVNLSAGRVYVYTHVYAAALEEPYFLKYVNDALEMFSAV